MAIHAEIDYLIQQNESIIPIEVKSGGKGKMQSLKLFMKSKNINQGIRIALENFAFFEDISVYPIYGVKNLFKNSYLL